MTSPWSKIHEMSLDQESKDKHVRLAEEAVALCDALADFFRLEVKGRKLSPQVAATSILCVAATYTCFATRGDPQARVDMHNFFSELMKKLDQNEPRG